MQKTMKYVSEALAALSIAAFALSASFASADTNWTLSGTNIYNTNSGNVGIGTTAPATALNVVGTVTVAPGSGNLGLNITGPNSGITLQRSDGGSQNANISLSPGGYLLINKDIQLTNSGYIYSPLSTGGYMQVGIYGSSIGTANTGPLNSNLNSFAVNGGTYAPTIANTYSDNTVYATANVNSTGTVTARSLYGVLTDNSSGVSNTLYGIYTDVSGGTNTSANRYAGAFMGGNVGIGTATPSATLDVKGNVNLSGATSNITSNGDICIGTCP